MKNRKCPNRSHCWDYKSGNCENCDLGDHITKLHKKIDLLKAKNEELIYKLECLLCHATGGLLSKHTYDLRTMESAVTDYVEKCCDSGNADLQDALNCQVEINAHLSGEYLSLMKESESQKAEIERLSKLNEEILMDHRFDRRPGGDCWNDVIEKAKTKVANEIFAEFELHIRKAVEGWQKQLKFEIEKYKMDMIMARLDAFGYCIYVLNNLREKYTKGENDDNTDQ